MMKKIVKEEIERTGISSILKPKSPEDVTNEIKRRLTGKDIKIEKQTDKLTIYHVKKASDINEIIRNMGGKERDVFFNFYLILDNDVIGFNQVIGVEVSPDGDIKAMNGKGENVDEKYLEKYL